MITRVCGFAHERYEFLLALAGRVVFRSNYGIRNESCITVELPSTKGYMWACLQAAQETGNEIVITNRPHAQSGAQYNGSIAVFTSGSQEDYWTVVEGYMNEQTVLERMNSEEKIGDLRETLNEVSEENKELHAAVERLQGKIRDIARAHNQNLAELVRAKKELWELNRFVDTERWWGLNGTG